MENYSTGKIDIQGNDNNYIKETHSHLIGIKDLMRLNNIR
jgi:hypothetical protein